MIEDQLATQWEEDARVALARSYGDRSSLTAHLAAVVLVLFSDRKDRERYIERNQAI